MADENQPLKVKVKSMFSLFMNISYFISLTLSVAQVGHHHAFHCKDCHANENFFESLAILC